MSDRQRELPHVSGELFLTDGGMETTLLFLEGFELPYFAAFRMMRDASGREALRQYYERYVVIARAARRGFVLESPTWRANPDWGTKLGYSKDELAAANRSSIDLLKELRAAHETAETPVVISGCVGPRGDGYDPGVLKTPQEAQAYHSQQIGVFAEAGVDIITSATMTNVNEAIGIARAARDASIPAAISFTVETDGRLPTGQSLKEAIESVDEATNAAPAFYMINCAHPTHFMHVLAPGSAWTQRIRGIRANASKRSHAELNDAPDLDSGDPLELASQYRDFVNAHPQTVLLGGCCGTDHRHLQAIANVFAR
jgi:S-methylmethionine-dependent homocysteine/selenocysteine methylase